MHISQCNRCNCIICNENLDPSMLLPHQRAAHFLLRQKLGRAPNSLLLAGDLRQFHDFVSLFCRQFPTHSANLSYFQSDIDVFFVACLRWLQFCNMTNAFRALVVANCGKRNEFEAFIFWLNFELTRPQRNANWRGKYDVR